MSTETQKVDVQRILYDLDCAIAESASTIERPLSIRQAKDEYWRQGLHAGITRARAEIAMALARVGGDA